MDQNQARIGAEQTVVVTVRTSLVSVEEYGRKICTEWKTEDTCAAAHPSFLERQATCLLYSTTGQ